MPHDPPLLGCATELPFLAMHRDWIVGSQRDLEIQDFCEPGVLDGDWRALVDANLKLLDGYRGRLGVHGPFWGFVIDCRDSEVLKAMRARLDLGLEVCARLGATQMVVHSPFDAWADHNFRAYPEERGKAIARTVENMAPVVARAAALGVELVIENIQDRDPAARAELAAAFGSPLVRLSIDTGHANYAHRVTGAPPPAAFVKAAGEALAHMHLQDTDGFADHHWHPGEGDIAWADVFAELSRLQARPRLIIEVKDFAGLRKGADWLTGRGLAR